MSKTISGRVQAVSLKPKKDYYGVCIDDEWYNGSGDLEQNLEEAEVELEVKKNTEDFIDIENYDIIEEDSEGDEQGRGSNPANGERESSDSRSKTSSTQVPRQISIEAQSMVGKAIDNAEYSYNENPKKHIDEVDQRSQAYNNIKEDRIKEIMNKREENLE